LLAVLYETIVNKGDFLPWARVQGSGWRSASSGTTEFVEGTVFHASTLTGMPLHTFEPVSLAECIRGLSAVRRLKTEKKTPAMCFHLRLSKRIW
jgi:hypothetical protein